MSAQLLREGLRLNLYNDPVGHCTIGIGHLVHLGPCDGRESEAPFTTGFTQEQAYELFRTDVANYERAVRDLVKVPLTQNQFDALVSFTCNVGVHTFAHAGLLSKLNQGDYESVPSELNRWVYASGQKLSGLVKRRANEGALFRDGTY